MVCIDWLVVNQSYTFHLYVNHITHNSQHHPHAGGLLESNHNPSTANVDSVASDGFTKLLMAILIIIFSHSTIRQQIRLMFMKTNDWSWTICKKKICIIAGNVDLGNSFEPIYRLCSLFVDWSMVFGEMIIIWIEFRTLLQEMLMIFFGWNLEQLFGIIWIFLGNDNLIRYLWKC